MSKALIFGGTTEGRLLYGYCAARGIPAIVYVATGYGERVLDRERTRYIQRAEEGGAETVTVREGRLTEEDMRALIGREEISLVLDATHPYAAAVTEHIRRACRARRVPCRRIVREERWEEGMRPFGSIAEAVGFLREREGNVFVTTGSKELQAYTLLKDYGERIYVRVLPDPKAVAACIAMGIEGRHLCAMQGPFSEEMNYAFLKEFGIRFMVAKQSGALGGFPEKWRAAQRAGAELLVIRRRAAETGIDVEEAMRLLEELK